MYDLSMVGCSLIQCFTIAVMLDVTSQNSQSDLNNTMWMDYQGELLTELSMDP